MSQRVMPPVVLLEAKPRTLHLVLPGQDRCAICGTHMLRMGFHYTDEQQYFDLASAQEQMGMWSPSDEAVRPYTPCGAEHGTTRH